MNFFHTYHPSPLLITFGPLAVHWYGLLLVAGGVAAYFVSRRTFVWAGVPRALLDELLTPLTLAGFAGARLYHVANELPFYFAHPFAVFAVWRGGLAIHGALIGGGLALYWFIKHNNKTIQPFSRISSWLHDYTITWLFFADLLVPGLAIAQAIGRWGNYFNQELYGRPTDLP